jgi:ferredoxin
MCEMEAPVIFHVPKKGQVELLDAEPPETEHGNVEAAIRYCPTQALRLVG